MKKPSKPRSTSRSPSSSWSDSLPRTKAGGGSSNGGKKKKAANRDNEDEEDFFGDKLDDYGLVKILATDLTLRDVPQAMRYSRERMFTPMPEQGAGMSSTRITEVLNFRRRLPPVTTTAHLQALLLSPTAVERETAELIRAGTVRKIVVLRRGGVGESLVQFSDLERMLKDSSGVDEETKEAFLLFLKENPAAQKVPRARLPPRQADQLVRAGFLTAHLHHDVGTITGTFSRAEDRGTMISLATVSRAASGSLEAVGGQGAVHAAGGTGGGSGGASGGEVGDLSLAVPGNGTFLKLVSAALAHLTSILAKAPYKECPETMLKERWDGGIAKDEARFAAKKERREFAGILPGRTRKWKEFYGLSFEWILHEAVGAGLIEVFDTRSVGRGVRLV